MSDSTPDPTTSLDARFVSLITRHQRSLYGYIMSLTGRPQDADDVLQEVNVVLWRKAAQFDYDRDFLNWACTIAYYEVLAHRKRRQRDRHLFLDDGLLREVAAEAQAASQQVDDRLEALRRCLKKLPAESRKLLQARYGEDRRPIRELEKETQRKAGAIYTALHRIRRVLLECIQQTLEPQQS